MIPAHATSTVTGLMNRLADVHILCLGDLMLDRVCEGQVERVSPEAPVPVLGVRRECVYPGGVGNVARTLSALGASCSLVGVVGADSAAGVLSNALTGLPRIKYSPCTVPDRPTTLKVRYRAGPQLLLRADWEDDTPLSASEAKAFLAKAMESMGACDAVILSDYGKGALSPDVVQAVIRAARARRLPVVVDPWGSDFTIYRGADVLTPNRRELTLASAGMPAETDGEVEAACHRLIRTCGVGAVLATRSEHGMTLAHGVAAGGDGHPECAECAHLPTRAREVFDVAGAGDTVAGVFTAGLAAGLPMEVSARVANAAAGVVVGKMGTAVATPDEIARALDDGGDAPASRFVEPGARVVSQAAAVARVVAWREDGLSVGFTNGCFDLLHAGHVSLLGQARAACDRLVVGLNSDGSVRRLKGAGRPAQGAEDRAAVLAAMSQVDLVVVFEEDTPAELITALEPDVLVKGADYAGRTVAGAELVERRGGRVVLAALTPGRSTTATLARLAKRDGPG